MSAHTPTPYQIIDGHIYGPVTTSQYCAKWANIERLCNDALCSTNDQDYNGRTSRKYFLRISESCIREIDQAKARQQKRSLLAASNAGRGK